MIEPQEDWNVLRDLVAPLLIIALVALAGYWLGGPAIFNP